jgi:hypothetical protein
VTIVAAKGFAGLKVVGSGLGALMVSDAAGAVMFRQVPIVVLLMCC